MKTNPARSPGGRGLTITEVLIAIVIVAALIAIFYPRPYGQVTPRLQQSKAVNNARQIALACRLYAQDNNGVFPTGSEPGSAPTNANTVLQDLFAAGEIELEALFWNPRATHVCAPHPPNENGILEPGENAFDYVSGLTNRSPDGLPLLIEAQTRPHTWDDDAGHPWEGQVVVAFADASVVVLNADPKTNRIQVEHASGEVDLLSISDEAGATPGNLPPEAVVKRAAPADESNVEF